METKAMSYEANVRRVVPYVPGEQPKDKNVIKLNTNENPYPPAPGWREIVASIDEDAFRKYPDPLITDLTHAIAAYHKVDTDKVFVGVGSDDVLSMAFLTLFDSDKPVLFPDITYSFYDVWADVYKIPYKKIPLDENFRIVASDYNIPNGGIVIANPNAPTGILESVDFIEGILKNNPDSAVIVDEAYIDFGGETCLPLLDKYENLLVVRTFSKSRCMAGLRIGYAIGNVKMIKYISDVKFSINSYTVNTPTIALGLASLNDNEYFEECCQRVIATRERTEEQLIKLGFKSTNSYANFLFVTHKDKKASEIYEALKERKIYVRYFNKPRIDNYLRISIGTDDEMETLVNTLKEIL
ncbi:MAG: histidinol-phosphate transaminase [Lachnospiraceae bacterium]|nr:histidinol-phosphate transaminase [Lachnospiraceae bacterium]